MQKSFIFSSLVLHIAVLLIFFSFKDFSDVSKLNSTSKNQIHSIKILPVAKIANLQTKKPKPLNIKPKEELKKAPKIPLKPILNKKKQEKVTAKIKEKPKALKKKREKKVEKKDQEKIKKKKSPKQNIKQKIKEKEILKKKQEPKVDELDKIFDSIQKEYQKGSKNYDPNAKEVIDIMSAIQTKIQQNWSKPSVMSDFSEMEVKVVLILNMDYTVQEIKDFEFLNANPAENIKGIIINSIIRGIKLAEPFNNLQKEEFVYWNENTLYFRYKEEN